MLSCKSGNLEQAITLLETKVTIDEAMKKLEQISTNSRGSQGNVNYRRR